VRSMKYIITKKPKKLTKELKNKRLEIVIPENQMIELAYKTPAGEDIKEQIVGAYVYLKIGDAVYPSIVEFSGDEVKIVGDTITKDDLATKAILSGRVFLVDEEICTCLEFVQALQRNANNYFTILKDNKDLIRVFFSYRDGRLVKKYLTVFF